MSKKFYLDTLYKNFRDIERTIIRKNASQKPTKIKIREYLIVRYWNHILRKAAEYEQEATCDTGHVQFVIEDSRRRLKECLIILKSKLKVHDDDFITEPTLTESQRKAISKIDDEDILRIHEKEIDQVVDKADEEVVNHTPVNPVPDIHTVDPVPDIHTVDPTPPPKMVQSIEDFFKLASKVLDTKFDGKPSELEPFIEQIELLEPMVEDANKAYFVKYVCTHLTGKAREALPDKPENVKEIIDALRKEIKYESSQVIEGKITALLNEKVKLTKFSEKAEKLAEDFRRSLIFEGHTRAKAQEMTIRKTVDLCYKSTRSQAVKAIVEAGNFATPSEVISKFVVQQNVVHQEFLTNKTNKNSNPNRNRDQNRKFRGNHRKNFQRNSNGNNQNQNQNNNGQNRSNFGRFQRGRSYRDNNRGQNANRTEQVLRIVGSENSSSPSGERRAILPAQSSNVQFELLN